jgi:hypothetical protein
LLGRRIGRRKTRAAQPNRAPTTRPPGGWAPWQAYSRLLWWRWASCYYPSFDVHTSVVLLHQSFNSFPCWSNKTVGKFSTHLKRKNQSSSMERKDCLDNEPAGGLPHPLLGQGRPWVPCEGLWHVQRRCTTLELQQQQQRIDTAAVGNTAKGFKSLNMFL